MALSKVNFNSMNVTPSASKAIKFNSSNNGLETGDLGGSLVLISTVTASSSATIEFTSGIDSTYKEYQFHFIDIHPQTDGQIFSFQGSTDGGSSYGVTMTSTAFEAYHYENDSAAALNYNTGADLAQSTGEKSLTRQAGNDNDQSSAGKLCLFNPSSTTFVKHFLAQLNCSRNSDLTQHTLRAGYFNTTSAVDAIRFKFASGNIDAGTIKMYGVS